MTTITQKHTVNTAAWINHLRTTLALQARGAMCLVIEGRPHYCCLGLGSEQAQIPSVLDTDRRAMSFGGQALLAPKEFVEWLGVPNLRDYPEDTRGFDIILDYPEDLRPRDFMYGPVIVSAAGLNDRGFSFHQIADMVDYFGIRGAR